MDLSSKGAMATIGAAGAVGGFIADRAIQLPSITGNATYDRAIDAAIGALIAYAGMKIDRDVLGAAAFGAGVGWSASALAGFVGV